MDSRLNTHLNQPRTLPFITGDLPGVGGEIKAEPSHFVVEEIPLYQPVGDGDHVYISLTRERCTTPSLQQELADLFGLHGNEIGYAGLKDKHARATQTFSLPLGPKDEQRAAELIAKSLGCRVEWVRRHRNKLKTGHLLGNKFSVIVLNPEPEALSRARLISRTLQEKGLPNYYGMQRFGVNGENPRRGRETLLGRGPKEKWLKRLLLSAYQSFLFNDWLARRILQGRFEQILNGDIAKKTDTGGLFEVTDAQAEFPRFKRGEITFTGPIYGSRMKWPGGQPGELERELLEESGITQEMLKRARLKGSRRAARLFIHDLSIESHAQGLKLTFSLPKGAYATTVLREFMKNDSALSRE